MPRKHLSVPKQSHSVPTFLSLQLAFWLALPSIGLIQKLAGLFGLGLYLAFVFTASIVIARVALPAFCQSVSPSRAGLLALATVVAIAVVFAAVYPIANAGAFGGGSDSDDALDIAASRLLAGQYPYSQLTYLDNPISPLPGAVLLAVPFVLLGGSALQNIFWFGAVAFAFRSYLKSATAALVLCWTLLAAAPVVLANIVTGTDYLANAAYITGFTLLVLHGAASLKHPWWNVVWPAALLGIGLSSRANYLLVVPLLTASLVRRSGARRAAIATAIAIGTCAAVTLPFYLADPAQFSPLHTLHKLDRYDGLVPHVGLLVSAVALAVTAGLTLRTRIADPITLFETIAISQAIPVVCALLLSVSSDGARGLLLSGFAVPAMLFGTLAAFGKMVTAQNANGLVAP